MWGLAVSEYGMEGDDLCGGHVRWMLKGIAVARDVE